MNRAQSGVTVVLHAAALKQVPACEYNPFEAIQTNILGGRNVIEAAVDQGVRRILSLSADKAVNPVNLYGAAHSIEKNDLFLCKEIPAGHDRHTRTLGLHVVDAHNAHEQPHR